MDGLSHKNIGKAGSNFREQPRADRSRSSSPLFQKTYQQVPQQSARKNPNQSQHPTGHNLSQQRDQHKAVEEQVSEQRRHQNQFPGREQNHKAVRKSSLSQLPFRGPESNQHE